MTKSQTLQLKALTAHLRQSREYSTPPLSSYFISGMRSLHSGEQNYPLAASYLMARLRENLSRFENVVAVNLLASQLDLVMDTGFRNLPSRAADHEIISYVTIAETGLANVTLPRVSKGNKISKSEVYCALSVALCARAMSAFEKQSHGDPNALPDQLLNQAQHALGMAMGQHPWKPSKEDNRKRKQSPLNRKIAELVSTHIAPISKQAVLDFMMENEKIIRRSVKLRKRGQRPLTEYLPSIRQRIRREHKNPSMSGTIDKNKQVT